GFSHQQGCARVGGGPTRLLFQRSNARGFPQLVQMLSQACIICVPYRPLRRITPLAGEQIHEVVDAACCRLQLVKIEMVPIEVHERIASLGKARTKRSEVSSSLRVLHAS